jgi:hypothetical protein
MERQVGGEWVARIAAGSIRVRRAIAGRLHLAPPSVFPDRCNEPEPTLASTFLSTNASGRGVKFFLAILGLRQAQSNRLSEGVGPGSSRQPVSIYAFAAVRFPPVGNFVN